MFKIELWYTKYQLNNKLTDDQTIWSYPIMTSLSLERQWYLDRYLRNKSIKSSLLIKLAQITRRLKRLSYNDDYYFELKRRYYRFCDYCKDKALNQELDDILTQAGVDETGNPVTT